MTATVQDIRIFQELVDNIHKLAFNYASLPCKGNEPSIIQMFLEKQEEDDRVKDFLKFLKSKNWSFSNFKESVNKFIEN